MLDRHEIDCEIERMECLPTCYKACERLAILYIVREHMDKETHAHDEREAHGDMRELTTDEAKRWVSGMMGTDPERPRGGRWTMEEAKALAQRAGWNDAERLPAFYAIINALYSDYYAVTKKYGVATPEFFADLAAAWLADADAKPHKAERYYKHIVQ